MRDMVDVRFCPVAIVDGAAVARPAPVRGALGARPGGARGPGRGGAGRDRQESGMTPGDRVLLMRLSERTNPKGRRYFAGRLGDATVLVLQAGATDRDGNPVWEV